MVDETNIHEECIEQIGSIKDIQLVGNFHYMGSLNNDLAETTIFYYEHSICNNEDIRCARLYIGSPDTSDFLGHVDDIPKVVMEITFGIENFPDDVYWENRLNNDGISYYKHTKDDVTQDVEVIAYLIGRNSDVGYTNKEDYDELFYKDERVLGTIKLSANNDDKQNYKKVFEFLNEYITTLNYRELSKRYKELGFSLYEDGI
jgi:hypothetical protein